MVFSLLTLIILKGKNIPLPQIPYILEYDLRKVKEINFPEIKVDIYDSLHEKSLEKSYLPAIIYYYEKVKKTSNIVYISYGLYNYNLIVVKYLYIQRSEYIHLLSILSRTIIERNLSGIRFIIEKTDKESVFSLLNTVNSSIREEKDLKILDFF